MKVHENITGRLNMGSLTEGKVVILRIKAPLKKELKILPNQAFIKGKIHEVPPSSK